MTAPGVFCPVCGSRAVVSSDDAGTVISCAGLGCPVMPRVEADTTADGMDHARVALLRWTGIAWAKGDTERAAIRHMSARLAAVDAKAGRAPSFPEIRRILKRARRLIRETDAFLVETRETMRLIGSKVDALKAATGLS